MQEFMSYLPDFGEALLVTLGISLAAAMLGLVLGFGLNALRLALPLFTGFYRLDIWLILG
ncbi:amino acid ABC transporter permease, partial [Pseudomonas gingeri]|nr:amino acid ABC transporter permease [Pseudomonas gingeri]